MPDLIHTHPAAEKLDQYTFDELNEHIESNFENLNPEKLARTSPFVVGSFLERLTVEQVREVLRKVSEEVASLILAEMHAEDSAEVLSEMREFRAAKILELLAPDDAADLISKLEVEDRRRLLRRLPAEEAITIHRLLRYDPDTAGGVMNPEVVKVDEGWTVGEAIENIRKFHNKIENFYEVYVLNTKKELVGITSIQDLFFSPWQQKVSEFMNSEIKGSCFPDEDKESVANKMAEHNLAAIPVVDRNYRLLGIVTHDDVLDIVQEAATEDMQKLHGAGADESLHDGIIESIKKRNPWLFVNLITAFLAATVISHFEKSIQQVSVLAAFMTVVASIGGSTGAQTLAVAIRGLALDELHKGDAITICLKEALKGLLNGLIVGLFSGLLTWWMTGNILIGATILFAMMLNMILSCFVGAVIPLVLRQFNFDPAQSSYIFLTAITDMAGLFIFLSIGTKLLL